MIDGFGKLAVKQSGCRYEVGDLVWGKVRSHPWWPGQIFHEAFALPCVSKTKRRRHVLVAFFGDNSYGWFDPFELVPFEINYVEKSKQTNDWEFVNAVRDAMDEARRRAALGLSCQCQITCNFRATGVKGLFEVDVCGHQPGGLYSAKQIKNAREWFRPFEVLCFLKKLASMPYGNSDRSINWIKNEAVVLAYRKAVFEEVDETYVEAHGSQLIHGEIPNGTLNLQGHMLSKDGTVRTFSNMSITHGRGPSGKETTTLKKKSICKEISLIKPLVYRETGRVKNGEISQDFQELHSKVSKAGKISRTLENVHVVGRPSDAVLLRKVCITSSGSLDEKPRALKCFGEHLHSEETPKINKKRRKKECNSELGLGHKHNCLKKAKRESGIGALSACSSDLMAVEKTIGFRRVNASKLPHLLGYLSDLALDPLHSGQQPNISATMLPFFLEFRSFIYKKVVTAPAAKAESTENSPTKSPACSVVARSPYIGTVQNLPSALKPPKKRLKYDDYENVRLNGGISDVGKQKYVEEPKRLNELKALIEERKPDDEIMNVTFQTKLTKYSHKNHDTSGVTKPKMVVIQFPSQSSLPSVSELKARFARFGQFRSPPRVIWKSSICQVLFKSKSDAKAAYSYAVKNRSLFGSVKVEYYLQAPEPLATEFPTPGKQLTGRAPDIVPCVKPTCTSNQSTKPRSTTPHHQLMHPSVQPKSCLEKQQNDEGTPLLASLPPLNRISHERENRKVNHLEVLKMQVHQPKAATNNLVHASGSSQSTDISGEMLNLLMRCQHIVAELKCSLGYVPLSL